LKGCGETTTWCHPEGAKATEGPHVRTSFASGVLRYTDDSVVRHGVLEAQIAFLQKPFTPESLARKGAGARNGTG
jgi:hypothetical protein